MTIRVAIGPFDTHDEGAIWPTAGASALAPEFDVVVFSTHESPPPADISIHWSPEYNPTNGPLRGYRVAVYGDWHVVPLERHLDLLRDYQAVCADYRGAKRLRDLGVDAVYFRQFSFDPRLHFSTPGRRTVAVSFMGRPTPHRQELRRRIEAWGENTGRRVRFILEPFKRGEEAVIYRDSQIVLGDAARGELQMRAYEAMACGALYVCQMDTDEIWQAKAPIPTYQDSTLEAFLDAWLENEPARLAKVKEQAAWVANERPVDHLRYLLRQIKQRMEERDGRRGALRPVADGGHVCDRAPAQPAAPTIAPPPDNEQRRDLIPFIPASATRLIDIGTHASAVPWAIKQERPSAYVVGLDIDERLEHVGRARCDEFYLFNITAEERHWQAAPWYREGWYSAALLLDIAEHVIEPDRLLKSVRPLLAPDGVIVASIPQVRNAAVLWNQCAMGRWEYYDHAAPHREFQGPQDNILAAAHTRFFCRADIEGLFTRAGFTITKWGASYMSAPGLEGWTRDLADLVARHGGDAGGFVEAANVIQWYVQARLAVE